MRMPRPSWSPTALWDGAPQRSRPRHRPRYNGDDLKANLAIVDAVTRLAATKNATPAQIALAWRLTRGGDIIPIPGGSRRSHLRDDLAASTCTALIG